MKKIVLLIFITIFAVGCSTKQEKSVFSLEEIMNKGNYKIIDVRTKEEYSEKHIKEAINIPLDEISKIEYSKDITLLVYCKSGARSKQAYELLKNKGYTVYDLGGIENINLEKE